MNILKRFEIWILLLLVGGAVAFVVATGGDDDESAPPPAGGAEAGSQPGDGPSEGTAAFKIDASQLKRDVGNAVLELQITYDNRSGEDLDLLPPTARLLSGPDPGDGDSAEEISPFFLAFSPPPTAPAGKSSPVVLKFWLEKRHLEGALWLCILDDTLPVKSAAPLDLDSLPDQETTVFNNSEWVASP